MCFAGTDDHGDISGAGIKLQRNQRKDKKWLQISSNESYTDEKRFKTDVFCLYVSTATKKGANRLDCAWLTLLEGMTRSRWNGTFKSFIKVWTFRYSFTFFRVSRKKRNKKRLIRKMKNCNFAGTMSILKSEIAKRKGHRKTQTFLNATMYGARLVVLR